jgi:hypothetical protein
MSNQVVFSDIKLLLRLARFPSKSPSVLLPDRTLSQGMLIFGPSKSSSFLIACSRWGRFYSLRDAGSAIPPKFKVVQVAASSFLALAAAHRASN